MKKPKPIIFYLLVAFSILGAYVKGPSIYGTGINTPANHSDIFLNASYTKTQHRLTDKSMSGKIKEWEVAGNWPYGSCNTAIADRDYVYIGTGGVIIIADNSDPLAPVELSRIVTPGAVWKLFRSGDYLYVANRMAGLRIIDVSDPYNPVEVSSVMKFSRGWKMWDYVSDVYVLDNYAYVSMGGLYVFDVSDPANPIEVAHRSRGWSFDIEISSDYAYVVSDNRLHIFDISDPVNPLELSNCLNLHSEARVYVSNGFAYVTDTGSGFYVVDVRNPSKPKVLPQQFPSDHYWDVCGSGNYVYVVSHDTGLHVLDISNPKKPKKIGRYHDISADWEDLYFYDGYVYLTFSDGGLRIIDVKDPKNPTQVGFVKTSGGANDVFVSGRYAYMANFDFHILDINDPSKLKEVGSIDTLKLDASGVHVSGKYAYVYGREPNLRIIDVSHPTIPQIIGTCAVDVIGVQQRGIFVNGNYAYLLGSWSGLHIIDVSDPLNPVEIGRFRRKNLSSIYVSDHHAYLTSNKGLRILDISSPANPIQVGNINLPAGGSGVYVSQGYAYLAGVELHIIDVSNPSIPTEVATYEGDGSFNDVFVSGQYAYVTNSPSSLIVLDIGNPLKPIEVANVSGIESTGVFVSCGFTYLVDTYFGLVIINNSHKPPVIKIKKTSLSFSEEEGKANPQAKYFKVKNAGGGILKYTLTPTEKWIKVQSKKGSSKGQWDKIKVLIDLSSLKAGRYEGEIKIKSKNACNSPQRVKIKLVIHETE